VRKAQVLKHLPLLKQHVKDIKAKEKEIFRLEGEVDALTEIASALDGVSLHNDFPVVLEEFAGDGIAPPSVEIFSGCDDIIRYAYASRDSAAGETPERWRSTGYKEEGSGEGKVLVEGATRSAALRAGKDYVSTGKATQTASEQEPAKKRGRPPKVKPVA